VEPKSDFVGQTDRSDTRSVEELAALLEVSKALSAAVDLDELLRVIVRIATQVLAADRSSLFLYEKKSETLWGRVAEGVENAEIRFPVGQGLAGDVARCRQLVNIQDAYADPRFNPVFDEASGYRTRSVLCAPILSRQGELLGVLQTLNKTNGTFQIRDEAMIEALASHVAVALERARLTEALLEKQRMEETLRLASQIQADMLPRCFPAFPHQPELDVFATMEPARQVGGDFYDFFLCSDGRVVVLVGDVADKGVPASLLMAVTKTYLRAFALSCLPPESTLARVNRELCREVDNGMFVTVLIGVLDPRTGIFCYANAGHNPPLQVRRGGDSAEVPMPDGMALGVLPDARFESCEIRLNPGDEVLLYTDGLTDAMNAHGDLLSLRRVRTEIRKLQPANPESLVRGILEGLRRFTEGAPQADDITLLALEYRGTFD
jgi:serine phosphatase RsbU (regulator of sigma subunit)